MQRTDSRKDPDAGKDWGQEEKGMTDVGQPWGSHVAAWSRGWRATLCYEENGLKESKTGRGETSEEVIAVVQVKDSGGLNCVVKTEKGNERSELG